MLELNKDNPYQAMPLGKKFDKTYSELGELVEQWRRNIRNRSTEAAVKWYVDTLCHYPTSRRLYLNSEVIRMVLPTALESLTLVEPRKSILAEKKKPRRNKYLYCDIDQIYIDLKYLHTLWKFRRSRIYVFYTALYYGQTPNLGTKDTAYDLIIKEPDNRLRFLSYCYWRARKKELGDFDTELLNFKKRTKRQLLDYEDIHRYVIKFLIPMEFPRGLAYYEI